MCAGQLQPYNIVCSSFVTSTAVNFLIFIWHCMPAFEMTTGLLSLLPMGVF
jgi:hypothetical protein